MKTRSIVLLIVAGALILVGAAVALGAVLSMNFDFKEMNTMTFTEKTYNIEPRWSMIPSTEAYPSTASNAMCSLSLRQTPNARSYATKATRSLTQSKLRTAR